MTQKNKKPKWDGKSRVSNDKFRKRYSEIKWSNMDEIHKGLMDEKEKNLKDEKEKNLKDEKE
jgi:hypothetical protein